MKPHEIIEIVLLSVSKHYGVQWQEIISPDYRLSINGKPTPRAIAIHYLNIYIGKDLTKDVMKCSDYNLGYSGERYRTVRFSLLGLHREIYLNTKAA